MVEANVQLIPGVVDVHNHLKLRNRPTDPKPARKSRRSG
jgi:hypothetical protein